MMFDDVNETDGMRLSQTSNLQSKFVGKLRIKQNNVSLKLQNFRMVWKKKVSLLSKMLKL